MGAAPDIIRGGAVGRGGGDSAAVVTELFREKLRQDWPEVATDGPPGTWQSDETPAELVRFAALSTTARAQAFLAHLARRYPERIELQTLGTSVAGRPILAVHLPPADDGAPGRKPRPIRALVFAQQHGDEPAGHEASLMLARDLAAGRGLVPADRLDLWIVPQLNPDGAAHGRRRNADGLDLNRGHHVLAAPELRLLYRLYHRLRPHVVIDLHQFNVERHRFTDGAICDYDVMADASTSPNVSDAIRDWSCQALARTRDTLAAGGYAFRRYLRGDPSSEDDRQELRHSTVHVSDGRHVPAMFGSLAFIVEATRHREPLARLERRVQATYATVSALLRFAADAGDEVIRIVRAERRALKRGEGSIVLRTEYRTAPLGDDGRYRFVHPDSGERGEYLLPLARTAVVATRARALPHAYLLHFDPGDPRERLLLDLLAGHGIRYERLPIARRALVERFTVVDVVANPRDAGRCMVDVVGAVRTRVLPPGALLVPMDQLGGRLAGIVLEPDSMDGLLAGRRWPARVGDRYPAERILQLHPADEA